MTETRTSTMNRLTLDQAVSYLTASDTYAELADKCRTGYVPTVQRKYRELVSRKAAKMLMAQMDTDGLHYWIS